MPDAGEPPVIEVDAGAPFIPDAGMPPPLDSGPPPPPDAGVNVPEAPETCGDGTCQVQTECGICDADCGFLVLCEPACDDSGCAWCGDLQCHDTLEDCGCEKDCGFCDGGDDETAKVLDLINAIRAAGAFCGVHGAQAPAPPLALHQILGDVAIAYSARMATENFFAHVSPDGSDPQTRVEDSPYAGSFRGENLAAGYLYAADVVDGWLNSDGHCRVMMHPTANDVGLGYAWDGASTYKHYWTMVLGQQ
jgi:hypothetical protein